MKYIKAFENISEGFEMSLDKIIKLSNIENNNTESKKYYYDIINPYMMKYLKKNKQLLEEPETFKKHSQLKRILFIELTHPYFRKYTSKPEEKFQVEYTDSKINLKSYSSAYFTVKDMEDFLDYMRNPKLYKTIKNYNL